MSNKLLTTILLSNMLFFSSTIYCQNSKYSLHDFYTYDVVLEYKTDSIFRALSDTQRVAQMIITSAGELGKPENTVKDLTNKNSIGGVVFLRAKREEHKRLIKDLNHISNKNNTIGLLFSMDAEPSLFNGRITGTSRIPNTIDIKTPENCDSIASIICNELKDLGIHQNYAPVVDISPNNKAIRNRSFGNDPEEVVKLSKAFINTTQNNNIIATAKHFPGHGLVIGDTHEKTVYIDGELQELSVYGPLIKQGVISIIVAHITVRNNRKYNTNGLPASCSRNIVTNLLKDSLDFKGLIVSDALGNMRAVSIVDKPTLKASMAGCDIILMPDDESKTISYILNEMQLNAAYQAQVYQSVMKIIRLKICLGIIKL